MHGSFHRDLGGTNSFFFKRAGAENLLSKWPSTLLWETAYTISCHVDSMKGRKFLVTLWSQGQKNWTLKISREQLCHQLKTGLTTHQICTVVLSKCTTLLGVSSGVENNSSLTPDKCVGCQSGRCIKMFVSSVHRTACPVLLYYASDSILSGGDNYSFPTPDIAIIKAPYKSGALSGLSKCPVQC